MVRLQNGRNLFLKTNRKPFSQDEVAEILLHKIKAKDYKDEEEDDQILNEIRSICYSYLDNEENISDITDHSLILAHDFLYDKFMQLIDLKNKMKIQNYNWPFMEVSQTMDEFVLTESMKARSSDSIKIKLTKEINYAIDQVGLTYSVIAKIMRGRQLDYFIK